MIGLFRRGIQLFNPINRFFQSNDDKMLQFTEAHLKQQAEQSNRQISKGRAWYASELRLKSTDELHKLWYVLLKEKNQIYSDNEVKKKYWGQIGRQGRLGHVKRTMARLLTVIGERRKVRDNYIKQLEDEYINQQQLIKIKFILNYEKQIHDKQNTQSLLPLITPQLIRSKWNYLKSGIDNHQYIEDAIKIKQRQQQYHQYLRSNYMHLQKNIKSQNNNKKSEGDNQNTIDIFSAMIEKQIQKNEPVRQEEILRSHVKNWKMLNLKQKRIILGFINAKRARKIRQEFLKELDLVGRKIAYDQQFQKAL